MPRPKPKRIRNETKSHLFDLIGRIGRADKYVDYTRKGTDRWWTRHHNAIRCEGRIAERAARATCPMRAKGEGR